MVDKNNVVSIFDYIRREQSDAHSAVMRALDQPLPMHNESNKLTREALADWFLRGLYLEGYKVVPCEPPEE